MVADMVLTGGVASGYQQAGIIEFHGSVHPAQPQ
jgi:hypothetical protein